MTDSLPVPPELDPAALAASEFTRSRRGLEATEVRAVLGRAADALRAWEERDVRLQQRIAELEERLDESHELDESRIATVLGEETARIVTAAREAAAEIRTKSEEQAARLIRETEEQATAAAEALKGEAQALRDDAAAVQAESVAAAEELRASVQQETTRVARRGRGGCRHAARGSCGAGDVDGQRRAVARRRPADRRPSWCSRSGRTRPTPQRR